MLKIFLSVLLVFLMFPLRGLAAANPLTDAAPIKAAFIRDGNLWTLINNKETQITKTGKVYDPAWSYDGKWISYQHEAPSELPYSDPRQYELWVYNVETHNKKKIFRDGDTPQWAPNKDLIAYEGYGLNVSDVNNNYNVAPAVHGYAWFPNGNGFLLASQATPLPDGWTSPILYKKQLNSNLKEANTDKNVTHFFTLPKEVGIEGKKVWSINAESFNYSPSGKWISFIVSPTASWAMDSNMLCVLSNDGKDFNVLDEVITGVGEPKWAPNKEILAFIAGGGRIVAGFKDKKLKWKELPANGTLTPANYAELDFIWVDNETLITSRVKEKDWSNDPNMHPHPSLYTINLTNQNETTISQPPSGFGDYHPKYIKSMNKLIWLRGRTMFDQQETVWMSDPDGGNAKEWFKNVENFEVFQP